MDLLTVNWLINNFILYYDTLLSAYWKTLEQVIFKQHAYTEYLDDIILLL